MSKQFDRAKLLFQQARYPQAAIELRKVLLEEPDYPPAHALLGLCLVKEEKFEEATIEAGKAIAAAPDWSYAHYCLSLIYEQRRRYTEAEDEAREALRLDPDDADNYARYASTQFMQNRWQPTLDAAMQGLQLNGEHEGCRQLRAMALTKLGRADEAIAAVDESLKDDPESDIAHTNKGWTLLHQGKPREALVHFREALRIDPNYEYARAGMVEALKARHFIYRWMLGYFLWMARLDSRVQWGLIIGAYFGSRFLGDAAEKNPSIRPYVLPVQILYVTFVVLTWFAVPAFNLLLRLNRFGWYALSPDQRKGANAFAVCLLGLIAGVVGYFTLNDPLKELAGTLGLVSVALSLPLVTVFQCERGWPRQMMALYTAGVAVVGAVLFVPAAVLGERVGTLVQILILGFLATPWLANYLMSQTVRR